VSVLGAGFYGPTEGEKKRKAVADAARKMAKAIEELPNTSDEEKAELKRDLRNIGVNALSTVDHDYCDGCGNSPSSPTCGSTAARRPSASHAFSTHSPPKVSSSASTGRSRHDHTTDGLA